MMKSVRSFLHTMSTPTAARRRKGKDKGKGKAKGNAEGKEASSGTPDTAAESPVVEDTPQQEEREQQKVQKVVNENDLASMSIPELYQLLDTQLRVNIGTSVKCGICLSTLQHPMRTPCGHAFCHDCILASLHAAKKCPECQSVVHSKRSLQPASQHLQALAKLYKQSLVEFGFTPSVYQANFTTLTQRPQDEEDSDDDNENDQGHHDCGNDTLEDVAAKKEQRQRQLQLDRWQVASTWQQQALPNIPKTSQMQRDENDQVVQANQQACQQAGYINAMQQSTQEYQEAAREQEAADYELENIIKPDEEDERNEQEQAARGSSEGSSSTNRRVKFQSTNSPPPLPATVTTRRKRGGRPAVTSTTPKSLTLSETVPGAGVDSQAVTATATAATLDFAEDKTLPAADDNNDDDADPTTDTMSPFRTSDLHLSPIVKRTSLSPTPEGKEDDEEESDDDDDRKVAAAKPIGTAVENKDAKMTVEESVKANATWPSAASSPDHPHIEKEGEDIVAAKPAAAAAAAATIHDKSMKIIQEMSNKSPSQKAAALSGITALDDNDEKCNDSNSVPTTQKNDKDKDNDKEQQKQKQKQPPSPRVSGLVEDSFGALHWTKRASLTLSSTQGDENDQDDVPMTLTMTYDDPSRDYAKRRAEWEAKEREQMQMTAAAGTDMKKDPNAHGNDGDPQQDEDSQETTVADRDRPSLPVPESLNHGPMTSQNGMMTNESSDNTAPMDSEGEEGDNANDEKEDDHAEFAARTNPANNENNVSNQEKAKTNNAVAATTYTAAATAETSQAARRRAQSDPTPPTTAAHAAAITDHNAASNASFSVGEIVNVQARTWSGINKPGGVARITKVHPDGSYNVAYVLGGKESNVDSVFVSASDTTDKRQRRETAEAALPPSLLQSLAAQGFDTTGTVTLEEAQQQQQQTTTASTKIAPIKPATTRSSNSSKLKDISNQSKSETEKSSANKKQRSAAGGQKKNASRKRKTAEDPSSVVDASDPKKPKASTLPRSSSTSTGRKRKSTNGSVDSAASKKKNRSDVSPSASVGKWKDTATKLPPLPSMSSLSDEEAVQLADSSYKSRFEAALQDKVIQVVSSALSDQDMDILKALTTKTLAGGVKIRLSDNFGKKTTICATPIVNSTASRPTRMRTAKAMRASLHGIPIVSPEWIQTCAEKNAFVFPTSEMISRSLPAKTDAIISNGESNFGIARMVAQLAKKAPLPLEHHSIFFCGAFAANRRKDLQLLARDAGAKVLSNASAVSAKFGKGRVVLLCHDAATGTIIPAPLAKEADTALKTNAHSVLVVNAQWIFESITCAKPLPTNAFPPVNAKAKELWQLGNQL